MKSRRLLIASLALLGLLLGACSPKEAAAPAAAAKREVSVEAIAAEAKGFTVGAMMGATTVYVFFDTQCPHCGHLWQSSAGLHKRVKFVWIPVGWINPSSTSQGAALLSSANPQALMTEHEALLLAGKGGMAASASVPSEIEEAIKANTKLLNAYGAESVPFFVAKNQRTGQIVRHEGALETAVLADFIGVDVTP
ncbi:MAG: DsbC family protein [Rhodoferax sp.]